MKKLYIILMALLVVSLPLLGACGDEDDEETTATTTLKLNHIGPENDQRGMVAQKFADIVNQRTDGRVEVEIYPNASLFTAATEFDATVTGSTDMFLNITYFHMGEVPWLNIFYLMGLYEDYEHIDRIVRHPQVNARLAEDLEAKGLHLLCLPHHQFWGQFFNSKHEVKEWKDMSDLRTGIRPGAPALHTDDYAGHTLVEVAQEEMFTAFSSGVVDNITVGAALAVSLQLWELGAEHCFEIRGGPMGMMLVMNLDTWNDLPSDIKDIITDEVCPEIMDYSYDLMIETHQTVVDQLKQHLKTWNVETEEDRAAMWEFAQDHPVVNGMKQQAGPEFVELIESLRPSRD